MEGAKAIIITEEGTGNCKIYPFPDVTKALKKAHSLWVSWCVIGMNLITYGYGGLGFAHNTCGYNGFLWLGKHLNKKFLMHQVCLNEKYYGIKIEDAFAFLFTEEGVGNCYAYPFKSTEDALKAGHKCHVTWIVTDINGVEIKHDKSDHQLARNTIRYNLGIWLNLHLNTPTSMDYLKHIDNEITQLNNPIIYLPNNLIFLKNIFIEETEYRCKFFVRDLEGLPDISLIKHTGLAFYDNDGKFFFCIQVSGEGGISKMGLACSKKESFMKDHKKGYQLIETFYNGKELKLKGGEIVSFCEDWLIHHPLYRWCHENCRTFVDDFAMKFSGGHVVPF